MALPIILPAIAEGAAALSAALGLTAIATKNDQKFGNINLNGVRTATGLNIAPLVISTGTLFNKVTSPTKVHVPSADNALVLRPEYRTETLVNPLEFIGYKPAWTEVSSEESSPEVVVTEKNKGPVSPVPSNPKSDDNKSENEENQQSNNSNQKPTENPKKIGFKSGVKSGWGWTTKGLSYIGSGLGWGVGFGIPAVGIPSGIYFGGKALGWWGNDNKKERVIEEIE